jgi:hypothetical protein
MDADRREAKLKAAGCVTTSAGIVAVNNTLLIESFLEALDTIEQLQRENYLVWSNEHRGWWGPCARGYSPGMGGAGRYTRDQALRICRDAIPSAMTVGVISEIPVRLADVEAFIAGQLLPSCILNAEQPAS